MMRAPLLACARAHMVRDAESSPERDATSGTRCRDPVGLEMLDVRRRRPRDECGGRVVDGDGERGRDVRGAGAPAHEGLERAWVSVGDDGHGIGELRDPLNHGAVHEPDAPRCDHLAERDAAACIRTARPEEHDGAGLHLDELHGGPGRGHRKTDPDDARRHVTSADSRAHPFPQRRFQRGQLGVKRGKEEDVAAHVWMTLYLSPRRGWSLATSGRADYP